MTVFFGLLFPRERQYETIKFLILAPGLPGFSQYRAYKPWSVKEDRDERAINWFNPSARRGRCGDASTALGKVHGHYPPETFTARLMRMALGWDSQATAEGRETTKVRQSWNQIIKRRRSGTSNSPAKTPPNPIASDGTRILKNWGGATHEVLVTESGATWNGESYTSLSAVARAMTGIDRNGPKFFGLREVCKS